MTSGRSELFLQVATELLSRGRRVRFRAEGNSMQPTIRGGEAIIVEPVCPADLENGDIALHHSRRGITAHRVVAIRGGGGAEPVFITRGDAAGSAEECVESRQILGRVSVVERKSWRARLLHRVQASARRLVARLDPDRRAIMSGVSKSAGLGMMVLGLLLVGLAATPASGATITSTASGGVWATGSTWVGGVAPLATDTVVIATTGGSSVTLGAAATCAGLTINSGAILTVGANAITVNGPTDVTGRLNISSATGTKTFSGDITLNAGAVWNETAAAAFTSSGSFTNNATTFTASTGTHTFSGAAKTINGSTTTSIANVAITGTYTNSGTLTVGTALSGAGGLTNSGTGTLNIGGNSTITTLTATDTGNTVNYTGAAQSVHSNNYYNLTLSGSGGKTLQAGTTTISGGLTLSGTATTTTVVGLTVGGNLGIGNGTTFTAAGFALAVTGTTTVGGGTNGNLTISSATGTKIFTGLVTVNPGATWNNSGNSAVTFRGGITNSGMFTAGTGVHTFDTNSQALTGTFSIPSATVTGVTLTNNSTLTVGTALSGTGGLTQAPDATLNIGGTSGLTTLTATDTGNTVNYTGAAQTVHGNNYYKLTLSGSGAKTLQTGTTSITSDLTLSGTATTTTVVGLAITGNLGIGNGTTFTAAGFDLTVTGTTTVGGGTSGNLTINSATGTKIFTGLVTVNAGGTWNNSGNSAATFRGGITNSGTFTAGTGVYTFDTGSQALTGTFIIPSVTVTGVTLTNNNILTVGTALAGTGGLTQAANATLNIGATAGNLTLATLTATANPNTVNYNLNGAQTVIPTTYRHLTLSSGGVKTMGDPAIAANGTLEITTSASALVANTLTLSVGRLTFNGVQQVPGTWGGTASSAINTSSTYFGSTTTGVVSISAGTITSNGSGDWNSTATWSPAVVPTAANDVMIRAGDAITVGVANQTANSIIFNNTSTSPAALTVNSGLSVNVTAGITLQNAASLNTAATIGGGGAIYAALVTVGGTTSPSSSGRTTTLTSTISTLSISGNLAITSQYSGYNNAKFALNSGSISVGGSVVFSNDTSGSCTSTLDMTGGSANGTLTLSGGTPFTTSGAGTFTFNPNGTSATVVYSGAAQTVRAVPYRNLTLSGSGAKTMTAVSTVNGNLTLSGTATATLATTLTVGGDVTIGSGTTLDVSASNWGISVGGNWSNSGTFTQRSGTVTFNGTGAQSIGGTTATTFYALTVNKSAGAVTLGINATATNFTLTAGTFDASTYLLTATTPTLTAGTLRVGATTWAANYSFTSTPPAGFTIEYYNSDPTINGAITYQNLMFSGSGTAGASGALTIQGNLSNTGGGTLDFGPNNVVLSGTVAANSIAGFTTTGTVSMTKTSSSTATLTGDVTAGALTINGSTGTLNLGTGLSHTIDGAVTLTAGTLNGGSSTLSVTGNWTGAATFTASTGTVDFSGSGAQSITSTTTTFNNLTHSGAGTGTLGAAVTINGDLTISGGTVALGANNVTLGGTGTQTIAGFTTTGTVTMTKTGSSTATLTGDVTAGALTINGSTGTLNLGTGLSHTINGAVTLTAGTLNGGSSTLSVTGNWTGAATFTANTGTVDFSGSGAQSITSTTTTFNNLTHSGAGTGTLGAAVTINGDLTISGGTVAFGANNVTLGGTGTQTIAGFTTTGTVTMTKTSGTATFLGNVNGAGLTISGAGGTLNLGTGLTHTFTGTWTRTAGTLDGGSSTLKIGGSVSGTGGIFAASTGTVEWYAGGAQTSAGVTYYNLIFSGSGAKSMVAGTTVSGNLSIAPTGTATASVGNGLTLSVGSLTLGGTLQVVGTWGSTASPAVHKNSTYFGTIATGVLNVGTGASATRLLVMLPNQSFTSGSLPSGTPSNQTAGASFNITLIAVSATNYIDSNYSGPATISYSGPANSPNGSAPVYTTSVTFSGGQATLVATTLKKAETTTITATNGSLTGVASSGLTINAGTASATTVETAANGSGSVVGAQNVTSGNSITVYSITRDTYGNFVANPSATWSLQNITGGVLSTDLAPTTGTSSTFTGRVVGSATIRAVASGFTGNSGTQTVVPGAIARYSVSATSPQARGVAFDVTVTAQDANNNTVVGDSSTVVTMSASSISVQFDANGDSTFGDNTATLSSGTFTISTKDLLAETVTITATDGNAKTGTSGSIAINAAAGDFRSAAAGPANWDLNGTWQTWNGSTWVAASSTPDGSADVSITIQSGHTVTDNVAVALAGALDVQGTLSFSGSGAITVGSGGIVRNSGTISSSATTLIFSGGGTYQHARNGGTIPTATWNVASTAQITGVTTTAPSGVGQAFGNFTWNCRSQSGNPLLGGALTTVRGNFTIVSTGSGSNYLSLDYNTGFTLNIGGDLIAQGGSLDITTYSNPTINLAGNYNQTGGTVGMDSASGYNTTFNFTGAGKTFTLSAGTFNTAKINLNVNTGASLTLNNALDVASGQTMTVNNGGTLYTGTSVVSGLGTFALASGGTLGIGSTGGIASSGATGNIQTTTRSFVTGANYTYNGGAAQVTGSGLPATVNNLTVSGSGTYVTLTAGVVVTTALTVDTGQFDQNACSGTTMDLTVGRMVLTNGGGYINCNSSSVGGTSGNVLTFNGTATRPELSVGSGSTFDYVGAGTITFNGAGATTNVSNAGVIRINGGGRASGEATCGDTAVSITVSNSTNSTWDTSTGNFYLADVALTRQVSSGSLVPLYGSSTKDAYSTGWGAVTACVVGGVSAPTAVRFRAFSAIPQDGGVLLQWRTGHEVDNLGFNIYRDGVRLTPSPIAGSALLARGRIALTAGNTYRWFDPTGTASSTYTLEDLDLNGINTLHGPFDVDTAAAPVRSMRRPARSRTRPGGAGGDEPASQTISQLGRTESIEGRWFTTSAVDVAAADVAAVSVAAAQATNAQIRQQYALAAGQAVKLGVRQEGWYHVEVSQLRAAGMPAYVSPLTLQLFVNGEEQDILVLEQNGRVNAVEFYGTGVDTTWSDTQVYWLTWGSRMGQRIQPRSGKGKGTAPTSFPFTVQWKPRVVPFAALINGDEDNFFGPAVAPSATVTQALPVTNVSAGTPGYSTLQVRMQGVTAGTHVVAVQLNATALGSVVFQDRESGVSSFAVSNTLLAAGATLTLTAEGLGTDVTFVDTVTLTYPHLYAADGDLLRFTAPSGQQVTITGFSTSQVRVMDVTDPANVTAPQGLVATQPAGGYSITFAAQGGGTRTLLAFTNAQMSQPATMEANQPSWWRSAQAGADMVIISHGEFIGSLAPLVALRQSQGLKVAVVNVADLYDEFNFGVLSPYAVKDFLATASTVWTRKPRWVLLVGDATFDPRDYLNTGREDYVPVELVGTAQLETASDDWFGDFNDDGIPEMAIGRLPVNTLSEAAAMVAKIVAYDTAGAAAWKNKALLVAGANDDENNFDGYIGAVQALLPPRMTATTILQGSDPDPAGNFLTAFNSGQGLVDFTGHGSTEVWQDDLFTSAAASTVTNGAATPFVMLMTCLNGLFQDLGTFSLAEALMTAPGGGAVGVWASSGLTESAPQAAMAQAMITALYRGGAITVGEAAVAAKTAVADPDVRRTWILFGDPSMKIK